MTYKTEGIIIKRSDFKEADLLLKVFTREKGKITVIAKGTRKIKSKLAGSLDLFYINKFMLAEGKNFETLCSAETTKRHVFLRNDLEKLGKAYYLGELLDKILPEREPNKKIYEEFTGAMSYLEKDPDLALRIFELRAFNILGFGPEVNECVSCHGELKEGECSLSHNFGGAICGTCAKNDPESYPVSDGAIKLIRMVLLFDTEIVKKISGLGAFLEEIRRFNEAFLAKILHRNLKSTEFIKKITSS